MGMVGSATIPKGVRILLSGYSMDINADCSLWRYMTDDDSTVVRDLLLGDLYEELAECLSGSYNVPIALGNELVAVFVLYLCI